MLADFGEASGDFYPASILWLRGAAEVNADAGSQSDFIRGYNKAQYEARTGLALSDAEMDVVSDAVAQQVFNTIVGSPVGSGSRTIPLVSDLAHDDAAPAAAILFPGNMGGWAGNHLFLLLGHGDAFYSNVIEGGSSTYDAVAMIKFTDEAFGTANWFDGIAQAWSYPSGVLTYAAGMAALDTFLMAAYSCIQQPQFSFADRSYIRSFSNTTLGRTAEGDALFGTESSDFIHGGGGDDTILGSLGRDVIDGAEGRDVVDYSQLYSARLFNLFSDAQSTADYVGYVTGTGILDIFQASFFGVEEIRGSNQSDEFRIAGIADTLEKIDGGENDAKGDFLTFVEATQGISIDLQDGTAIIGMAQVAVTGFEYIKGSGYNDTITGNDERNVLSGGEGADQLFGGGADDFIFFDADDTLVNGGEGRDVAFALGQGGVTVDMTAQELEVLVGGMGDDVISVGDGTGNLMVAGGAGADTITVAWGMGQETRILWGGDDAATDVFDFVNLDDNRTDFQLGILVVSVTGLTAANFCDFDLSMLGLPASFAWNAIDAVIINPNPEDRIRFWGDTIDTSPIAQEFYATLAVDENIQESESGVIWSGIVDVVTEGQSGTLGASLHMQTPDEGNFDMLWYRRYEPPAYTAFLDGMESSNGWIDNRLDELSSQHGAPLATWSVDMSAYDDNGEGSGAFWYAPAVWDGALDENDSWFVAGGAFNGAQLNAVDAPHATMPDDPSNAIADWLLAA